MIVVVVYGYQFMLLVNKIVVVGNTVLILLGIVAYASVFDLSYDPGPDAYALGSFAPTFVLSVLIVMGNPVSFGAFLGDWSRYIPADTSRRTLLSATVVAQLATLVPFLFGVGTATLVAGEVDYVFALVQASPLWYALLLMVVAVLGGMSTGVTSLYGTGLDFSSVLPRLSRVRASLVIGALSFVFIVVGRLAFDLVGSVNAFIGAIVICTTPWMVIMTLGYVVRRGHYDPVAVQVFNQGSRGRVYWFSGGVNWRGMVAWIPSAVIGLLFANYPPLIVGPFTNAFGGVDVSLPVALLLAAVLYLGSLYLVPGAALRLRAAGPALGAQRAGRGPADHRPGPPARRGPAGMTRDVDALAALRPARDRLRARRTRTPTSAACTPRPPSCCPAAPGSARARSTAQPGGPGSPRTASGCWPAPRPTSSCSGSGRPPS